MEEGPAVGGDATFLQSLLNAVTLLIGLAVLSTPYIFHRSGVFGLVLNVGVPLFYLYGAQLLKRIIDRQQQHEQELFNFQDIIAQFMGKWGRLACVTLFYMELLGSLVSNCISIADTLLCLFPDPTIGFGHLRGRHFLASVSALCILPTIVFDAQSSISYLSLVGLACITINLICLLYVGSTREGFSHPLSSRLDGIPLAIGVLSFSYAGIPLFAGIYTSMTKSSRKYFSILLLLSFAIAIAFHFAVGVSGALMFGNETQEQVHLNLPGHLIVSKIAIWTTIALPVTKFPLILTPVSSDAEAVLIQRLGSFSSFSVDMKIMGMLRTGLLVRLLTRFGLLAGIVLTSLFFPYFAYVVGIVGSFASIALSLVLPCIFYLKHLATICESNASHSAKEKVMVKACVGIGILAGAVGTTSSARDLIQKLK